MPRGALTRIATLAAAGIPSPETLRTYDGFLRLSSVTAPMGNQTTFDYLADGSVMTSCFGELTDAPGDTNNLLLARATTRTRGGVCQDGGANALFTRHYAHVDTQVVERFTPGSGVPTVLETTTVHRSPAGLITCVVCNRDTRVSYEYGELRRSTDSYGHSTLYAYDALHRLVSSTQDSSTVSVTHDSCGNPLSETSNGQTVLRSFRHRSRTGITYPDGRRFAENRGSLGELLSISALNPVGAPVHPPVVSYACTGHRIHTAIQANGTATTHTYRGDADVTTANSFNICIRTVTRNASSSVLSDVTVQRAPDQSPIHCVSLFTSDPDGPARFQTFSYDGLSRRLSCLTERREVTGGPLLVENDVAYSLDLEGRRLLATGGQNPGPYSQNRKIPPGDQQMGQYSIWPGGDLLWDETGNLVSVARGATTQTHTYDAEGRFVACDDTTAGTPVCDVTHDALGRISSLTVPGAAGLPTVTTSFVYDGSSCIQELTDPGRTGTPDPNLTFVSAGGLKVCISTRNGSLYYPHSSGGSQRYGNSGGGDITYIGPCDASFTSATDAAGVVVERIAYDEACKPSFLDGSGHVTVLKAAATGGGGGGGSSKGHDKNPPARIRPRVVNHRVTRPGGEFLDSQ